MRVTYSFSELNSYNFLTGSINSDSLYLRTQNHMPLRLVKLAYELVVLSVSMITVLIKLSVTYSWFTSEEHKC